MSEEDTAISAAPGYSLHEYIYHVERDEWEGPKKKPIIGWHIDWDRGDWVRPTPITPSGDFLNTFNDELANYYDFTTVNITVRRDQYLSSNIVIS